MPRNRYTALVRKSEYCQNARQEMELAALAKELRRKIAESTTAPFIDSAKERRCARLEQKRRYKPKRSTAASTDQP